MTVWLLAVALLQQPFAEPPREVLRAEPEPQCVGGAWSVLGPLPPALGGARSAAMRRLLATMRAGEPWPGLGETQESAGGRLLWRAADLDALADAAATRLPFPRLRIGLETGRIEPALLPLAAEDGAQHDALLYRVVHAREPITLPIEARARGGLRVWVNGELAGSLEREAESEAVWSLRFARGLNHLLIETAQPARGSWWFELRHRHPLTEAAVNRAIDGGMRYLLSRQTADGSWDGHDGYPSGVTALALFALLESGLPAEHPAAVRALAALRRRPPIHTYSVALALLAVHAAGDRSHDPWLQRMTDQLVEWQGRSGLWGYPDGAGDLSNTQFAALALRAAARRGLEVPADTWRDLMRATLDCRGATSRDGGAGFGYAPGGDATASMTAAGAATLVICGEGLGEDLGARARQAVADGIEWLGGHCALHAPDASGAWHYYLLYGLERAGALARADAFGDHPWYPEGADWLLERQGAHGGWNASAATEVETAFALLFLTRSTAKSAVTGADDGAGRLFASSAADGPLIVRAARGEHLDLWVDASSPEFARYARVVWSVRAPGGEWRPLPGGRTKRFDLRLPLERPGVWLARATAFLHDGRTLGSGTLEIAHGVVPGGGEPAGAGRFEPDANLLLGAQPQAEAGSASVGDAAAGACDGRAASRWLCAPDDPAPWLELRLGRRATGRTLVLRPVLWRAGDGEAEPEPARVRVTVNGAAPIVADLPEGWPARWEVDLGSSREVAALRVEILAVRRGRLGECATGFAEVELHAEAP